MLCVPFQILHNMYNHNPSFLHDGHKEVHSRYLELKYFQNTLDVNRFIKHAITSKISKSEKSKMYMLLNRKRKIQTCFKSCDLAGQAIEKPSQKLSRLEWGLNKKSYVTKIFGILKNTKGGNGKMLVSIWLLNSKTT